MASSAPSPAPTPSQPPIEILYAVPVGSVVPWYPPPSAIATAADGTRTITFPPGFVMCDGSMVSDPDSPFDGMALPNLVNRYALGSGGNLGVGDSGGDATFNTAGWSSPEVSTSPTAAQPSDDQLNYIIQGTKPNATWRYVLTGDDGINDGNHHHLLAANSFQVPAPGFVALIMIIRIK